MPLFVELSTGSARVAFSCFMWEQAHGSGASISVLMLLIRRWSICARLLRVTGI